jgi:hypothetical protein
MDHYWRRVFKTAWDDTKHSFGWNQKTVAAALIAIAGILVTLFQLGVAAMITSATGLFLTALPFAIAGLVLFAWNFFSTPPRLHANLGAKISALEAALANFEKPPPDYRAWRHVDQLTLGQAAFLWCDLEPSLSVTPKMRAWLEALKAAVKKGELEFVPEIDPYQPGGEDRQRRHQMENAYSNTIVTRSALQQFAKKHGYDPVFLRDT